MADRVHKITSLGGDEPRAEQHAPPQSEPQSGTEQPGGPPRSDEGRAHGVERAIDLALSVQRPVVVAHLRSIRRRVPNASPDHLIRILERRYLTAITTGGAAVGATAVIPGIGTGVTLALSGVETAGFLEATALFAQSVAEVHGIPVDNPDRARALVMTLMLGNEGSDLVRQFAGQATGSGAALNTYWGELVTNTLPKAVIGPVVDRLRSVFIRQFAVRGGAGIIGKAIPFGIGAAIGGIGNNVLGRRVLAQSRLAFGQPPMILPADLEPRERDPLLQVTGVRMSRAGNAVGGAVGSAAIATTRGIQAAGRAAGRAARGAITRRKGDAKGEARIDAPADAADERADAPLGSADSDAPPSATGTDG